MALSGAMCNDSDSENVANMECVTIAECTREVQGAISRFIRSMVSKKKNKKQAHIESKAENFQPSLLPKPSLYLLPMF